jgi:threonine dehydratase
MNDAPITLADIVAARSRIASGIYNSPCVESIPLSLLTGAHVFCKLDYLQRTGSFKERGARNALLRLSEDARRRGVVAASAGNHALGLAYHGSLLQIPVTVVMPRYAPLIKVSTCRQLGANVVLHGDSLAEARTEALARAEAENLSFVHPFDNRDVIAGQGTMGLEILEQVRDVEAIVVPVGGGGLIAGIATAVKTQRPEVQIIGVEPENAACYLAARENGSPTPITVQPTLADGLAVGEVGARSWAAHDLVDDIVAVGEEHLALAILRLIELEKSVVEGAGAAPLAAFLAGKLDRLKGRRAVMCLCGGNIDVNILDRVIEVGLVADGRLTRFTAAISDRPGALARLAELIGATGASIKDIAHDRAFSGPDVSFVRVVCTVETIDREHIARLMRVLADANVRVVANHHA